MRVVDTETWLCGPARPGGGAAWKPTRGSDGQCGFGAVARTAERLISGGFLKVAGTVPAEPGYYVAADEISEVDGSAVLLRVERDELLPVR
jgi:hypothetical protein